MFPDSISDPITGQLAPVSASSAGQSAQSEHVTRARIVGQSAHAGQVTNAQIASVVNAGLVPPEQLNALLEEYKDLFLEELPAGLPSDRGVALTIPLEEGNKTVKTPSVPVQSKRNR